MIQLKSPLLKRLAERLSEGPGAIRWIDLYAAQYVADCHDSGQSDVLAALTLALSFVGTRGATCLDLGALEITLPSGLRIPDWTVEEWQGYLQDSSAVDCKQAAEMGVGQAELAFSEYDDYPLVLDGRKVYFQRYWQLQQQVGTWLNENLASEIALEDSQWSSLAEELRSLFRLDSQSENKEEEIDWQACAAAQALCQKVCLITGGPGTGKTTTAANILSLLLKQHAYLHEHAPKVSLLAPTGKAAIRLQQSIQEKMQSSRLKAYLPESGETIHRFLIGMKKLSVGQNDDALLVGRSQAKADVDIVLIDEASMIDVALMAELVAVLPAHARVILLGDHYQLPAIEPGQIFSDWVRDYGMQAYDTSQINRVNKLLWRDISFAFEISEGNQPVNPVCWLKKTYRFAGDLKRVAEAMKTGTEGELKRVLLSLNDSDDPDVRWCDVNDSQLYAYQAEGYDDYFKSVSQDSSPDELARAFSRFQVLCSTHEGPMGARVLNQMIERYHGMATERYHGKAIMVTENHADLGVFNGDIGFYIRKSSGHYVVAFPDASLAAGTGGGIEVAPASIRAWQPAYAITVHKSQGSEYEHVSLVIADYARELLSRAMLYTGLTRGKLKADLWLSDLAIEAACSS